MNKFVKMEVERLVLKSAEICGFEIYEQHVVLRKGSAVISVKIDNGATVSHNDCAAYSGQLNDLLEEAGIEDDYILEIASPGLKRDIRNLAEFKRFVGSPVKVVYSGDNGGACKGVLQSADEVTVTVKTEKGPEEIRLENIKRANLDY